MSNPPAWQEPAICPKCSEPIQSYAGNPALWGVGLHYNGNGKNVVYHQGCVSETFRELSAAKAQLAEQVEILNEIGFALESRGYVHMTNGAGIGSLLDELATAREDMKEECAKVCDRVADLCLRRCADQAAYQLKECAAAIRALKP